MALALFYRAASLTTNLELFTPTYLRIKTKETGFLPKLSAVMCILRKTWFLTTRSPDLVNQSEEIL